MQWFNAGEVVPVGFYIAPRALDVRAIVRAQDGFHAPDGGRLRGVPGARYLRLPLVIGVLLTPAIGGAFAMTMPAVVLATLAREIYRRLVDRRILSGQQPAPRGLYLGLNRLLLRSVKADGDRLEAPAEARLLRIPTPVLVALSPIAGGLFVLLFPALVALAFLYAGVRLILFPFEWMIRRRSRLAAMAWGPSEAYRRHAEARAAQGADPAYMDDLPPGGAP